MTDTHTLLTKLNGSNLGYHRNVISSLIKRKAVIINGIIYAPVKKRVASEDK
jgi:hypothetical protein